MGFDPRTGQRTGARQPSRGVVTSNVDTLLAENDALRREVRRLRLLLQEQQMDRAQHDRTVTGGGNHGITAEQVERWGLAMARHPRWQELRIGPPGGLRGLVEDRRRCSWNPQLSLEQELERRAPGLGVELAEALRGPHSRVRWAVRAAFALHGVRAAEWLSDAPLRLVDDLLRLIPRPRSSGTRTENHSHSEHSQNQRASQAGSTSDPRRAALRLLGLEPGASTAAIKRAYRHLAKAHHPDLGGDVAAFHRLDAAYRLLIGSEQQG
ncbi:MAG: J domain-containing protein [Cyanobacteriota bacterium]